jgi:predicted RNA binding protein YcfA (HicA-like mRNA interferase family)
MAELPRVSGPQTVRALERAGFVVVRIKGSHQHLRRPSGGPLVTVPCHGRKELKPKTLKSILRQAQMTVEEFRGWLD